jgi:hypothetical protein
LIWINTKTFSGKRNGGDPDLFVCRVDFSEAFFLETKKPPDQVRDNAQDEKRDLARLLDPFDGPGPTGLKNSMMWRSAAWVMGWPAGGPSSGLLWV